MWQETFNENNETINANKKNRESIRDVTAELQVKIIWSYFINKQETKE